MVEDTSPPTTTIDYQWQRICASAPKPDAQTVSAMASPLVNMPTGRQYRNTDLTILSLATRRFRIFEIRRERVVD